MDIDAYATENGQGPFKDNYVRDLVPPRGTAVELLLILESPHTKEIAEGTPLVGGAGRSALEYLLGNANDESLGEFVDARHAAGDYRVAVVNVSNLPLQADAFDDVVRPLTADEWEVIRVVRETTARKVDGTMTPEANRVGLVLVAGLQDRVNQLTFAPGATVVLCGDIVQRFARSLTGLPGTPLKVYHPARNLWVNSPDRDEHKALRTLFRTATAPLGAP